MSDRTPGGEHLGGPLAGEGGGSGDDRSNADRDHAPVGSTTPPSRSTTPGSDNNGRCRVCGKWRGPDGCCQGSVTPDLTDEITREVCADEACSVKTLYSAYCLSRRHAKRIVRYVPEAEVERLQSDARAEGVHAAIQWLREQYDGVHARDPANALDIALARGEFTDHDGTAER